MRVACTEGRRGSQVGRGAVRGRIFRGAGAHQPVRDGVGRKLRPPRGAARAASGSARKAVHLRALPRPRDMRALPRAHVSCVHERVSGVSVDDFLRSPSVLTSVRPPRVCAAEQLSLCHEATRRRQGHIEVHAGSCATALSPRDATARGARRRLAARGRPGGGVRTRGERPAVVADDPPTER